MQVFFVQFIFFLEFRIWYYVIFRCVYFVRLIFLYSSSVLNIFNACDTLPTIRHLWPPFPWCLIYKKNSEPGFLKMEFFVMKKRKIIHILLFLFFITSTIFYCIHTEVSPPTFSKGELFNSLNNWKKMQTLHYVRKWPVPICWPDLETAQPLHWIKCRIRITKAPLLILW